MIRRSAGLAVAAVVLSLVLHFLGVGLTFTSRAPEPSSERPTETVSLGNSFDDVADLAVEPVEPEPVEEVDPPDPEEQPPVEPQEAEVPTSDARVASPNPQQTFSPDTGVTPPVSDEIDDPGTPETAETDEPDQPPPSAGTEAEVADARLSPPVETVPDASPQPSASPEPAAEAEPVEQATTEGPGPEGTLAPVPVAPQLTAPVNDVIAALPPETTPPVEDIIDAPNEAQEPDPDADRSGGAVTTSVRPPARSSTLSVRDQAAFGAEDDTAENEQASPQSVVSPLTLYSRQGIDLFGGQQRESRSRRAGSTGGLGPGNADTTNYAGQVLVHLNRTEPVVVSARGWARVTFRINPDGSLASVDIIDGSGSADIDRAARTQVRRGEPFPRPPDGRSRMLTFVYRLN